MADHEAAPERHPLDVELGNAWRWLRDEQRQTVVLLHRDGLYIEVSDEAIKQQDRWEAASVAIATSMLTAAIKGGTGRHTVTVRTHVDPRTGSTSYTATCVKDGA